MLNLCKMELYRGKKSKTVWITCGIIALLAIGNILLGTMGATGEETIDIGADFAGLMSQGLLLILWAISMAVYVAAEYKNGFLKSIAGQIPKRGSLALSKMIFALGYTILMFVVTFIVHTAAAYIVYGSRASWSITGAGIMAVVTEELIFWGFSMFIILLTQLTRTSSVGIAVGVMIACGLSNLLYTGITTLVNKISFLSDFNLAEYMLDTNLQIMSADTPMEYILRGAVIAVICIAAAVLINRQVLEKKDI